MTDPTTTRGYLNNNPGNLRYNEAIRWQGAAEPPVDDRGYAKFVDPYHGLRAMARDVYVKWFSGRKTAAEIVERYAPPNENNTVAYTKHMQAAMGTGPLELNNEDVMFEWIVAQLQVEIGGQPYDPDIIRLAIDSALAR